VDTITVEAGLASAGVSAGSGGLANGVLVTRIGLATVDFLASLAIAGVAGTAQAHVHARASLLADGVDVAR